METHMKLLILSLLVCSLINPSLCATRCNPSDYQALMRIKQALGNPYHLASWVPNTDCCNWYTLQCDDTTNMVIQLTIFQGNVSGQIPAAVGDLPFLENLTFRKLTNITGTIPQSVTKLKNLSILRLSYLSLSGPIPGFLSELTGLTFLELNNNQFSGTIPPSLSKFTKILAIHLDHNKLTGSIPVEFGSFTGSVPDLYLSNNQLTGPLPTSFANMDFTTIDLSRNQLSGDASMLFKSSGSAQTIDISRNTFAFDFSKVRFPTKSLNNFDINHNKIFGSIPSDIVKVENLQFLNVSYNQLCGAIPTGGNMGRIDASSYIHNKCLCGPPLSSKC